MFTKSRFHHHHYVPYRRCPRKSWVQAFIKATPVHAFVASLALSVVTGKNNKRTLLSQLGEWVVQGSRSRHRGGRSPATCHSSPHQHATSCTTAVSGYAQSQPPFSPRSPENAVELQASDRESKTGGGGSCEEVIRIIMIGRRSGHPGLFVIL